MFTTILRRHRVGSALSGLAPVVFALMPMAALSDEAAADGPLSGVRTSRPIVYRPIEARPITGVPLLAHPIDDAGKGAGAVDASPGVRVEITHGVRVYRGVSATPPEPEPDSEPPAEPEGTSAASVAPAPPEPDAGATASAAEAEPSRNWVYPGAFFLSPTARGPIPRWPFVKPRHRARHWPFVEPKPPTPHWPFVKPKPPPPRRIFARPGSKRMVIRRRRVVDGSTERRR